MKHTQEKAMKYFEEADFKGQLDDLYAEIPEGSCTGCTACCSESVNTFFSEYLNLRNQLILQGELEIFEKKAVYYYLAELIQPMKCPLLRNDGRCAVYGARPLPCRIFGHLGQVDYEANYEAILEGNREMAETLERTLGIRVPDSVIEKKIPYCEKFKCSTPMDQDQRDALVDDLFYLDGMMLSRGLLDFDEINLSLVQWFAYDALGKEEAMALRVQVAKEITQEEKSETLAKWA